MRGRCPSSIPTGPQLPLLRFDPRCRHRATLGQRRSDAWRRGRSAASLGRPCGAWSASPACMRRGRGNPTRSPWPKAGAGPGQSLAWARAVACGQRGWPPRQCQPEPARRAPRPHTPQVGTGRRWLRPPCSGGRGGSGGQRSSPSTRTSACGGGGADAVGLCTCLQGGTTGPCRRGRWGTPSRKARPPSPPCAPTRARSGWAGCEPPHTPRRPLARAPGHRRPCPRGWGGAEPQPSTRAPRRASAARVGDAAPSRRRPAPRRGAC